MTWHVAYCHPLDIWKAEALMFQSYRFLCAAPAHHAEHADVWSRP